MNQPWPASLACPQCGGTVDLAAGDPVFACPYCRSRLYLAPRGPLRYCLPPTRGAEPDRLVYLPFWRFRGLRFRVLSKPQRIDAGLLDATVQACASGCPQTDLGIRPQVSPLALTTPGAGRFLPVEETAAAALTAAERRLAPFEESGPLFERFVGEKPCLVYAPLLLDNLVGREECLLREAWGEGRRHVLSAAEKASLQSGLERPQPGLDLAFLPLICPQCASDLPAAPGAVALLCPYCARAWWAQGRRLAPLPYAAQEPSSPASRLFPFWHMVFRATRTPIESRADLLRLACPYQPVPAGWGREPCQAVLPAFKVHPRLFLRIARRMTISTAGLPDRGTREGLDNEWEPVRLPLTEAAEALKVLLAHLFERSTRVFPLIPEGRLKLHQARLVYLPFERRGSEWIGERTGEAIPAAALGWGTNL